MATRRQRLITKIWILPNNRTSSYMILKKLKA